LRSSASYILETALALRQSPGERFRLLSQPLPDGITHVVEIASGAPQALHDAALELGEPDAVVLEAARFYLEQMLFAAPDANAYRILGVPPQAEHELIRLHHRLLQRWLHPDRALAGDASIFATRVNQAWSRLRTPALRDEYDASLRHAPQHAPTGAAPAAAPYRWDYHDDGAMPRYGRRSRWLFAAALACSLVLAVLIVRHGDDVAVDAWDDGGPVADAGPAAQTGPDTPDLSALSHALGSHAAPQPAHAPDRPKPSPPTADRLAAAVRSPQTAPPARAQPVSPVQRPAPAPPVRADARFPAPSAGPSQRLLATSMARPALLDASAIRTPPTSAPAPSQPRQPVERVAVARRPAPSAPVLTSVLAPAPPPHAPIAAPAIIATAAPVPVPVPVPFRPAATAKAVPDGDPSVLLERMHKAEQRVAQVAAYLSATPGAAPLWNDVRTQADADRLKRRIAVRQGSALQLLAPDWQLRPTDASYSGTYRCDGCDNRQVRLQVQLVWREGLWLVRGVGLGPSA
jgi:hypothetical protein